MQTIHIVTAVSRPENLPAISRSIETSLAGTEFAVRWTLVVDRPEDIPDADVRFRKPSLEVTRLVHGKGRWPYGVAQKNLGMDFVVASEGWYHCLDDDNVVHPQFFSGMMRAMASNPKKRAFVVGQRRWDLIGNLTASPDRMEYGKIDNTMFVVHSSLIGTRRYDLDRSGREDFHFFRRLFDLNREEFVFVPETLAYYNYLRYNSKLPERVEEANPSPPAMKEADNPKAAVPEVRPVAGTLRIALLSSKRERCGISTYTDHLADALASLGHEVSHWGARAPYNETFDRIIAWKPDVLHVQHEASIMPEVGVLEREVRRSGTRAVVTLHTESESTLEVGRRVTAATPGTVILHRPTKSPFGPVIVPMPCTVVGTLQNRSELRARFGLPDGAFVLSTLGFMIPWKDHPKILETLLPWLRCRKDVHVQVLASQHWNQDLHPYAEACRTRIRELASNIGGDRIHHVDNYPSDREVIERLAASDFGYVWCPFDTGSSSAAAAQFISAKCPLLATDSSHYAYLGSGLVRGPKGDMSSFVELIQEISENKAMLQDLREAQWREYRTRNYLQAAAAHIDIYRGKA